MISASAQGATKLLEALEKLSEWAGSMPGGGPSAAPPRELVQAFEAALSAPSEGVSAAGQGTVADILQPAGDTVFPGPAESLPSQDISPASSFTQQASMESDPMSTSLRQETSLPREAPSAAEVDERRYAPSAEIPPEESAPVSDPAANRQEDLVGELARLLENATRPQAMLGPHELFRLQYLVGMLNVQGKAGVQTSQQTTQGLESLLRQSG